jgi:radical SAM protein with 4Fe4S-binding SPASM domain
MAGISIAQQVNRRASEKNIPLSVLIELTYRCNLSCYYCYQQSLSKEKELSCSQWSGILSQLAGAGTLYVTFSGGEWLVRNDALEIIAAARSRNFAVSIITNGTLLTAPILSQLADMGVMDIGISFHAASAGLHDRLCGKKGSFNRALKGLRFCVAAGMKTLIKHSVSLENFGEFVKLAHLARTEGCFFECDANVVSHIPGRPSPFALTVGHYTHFLRAMKVTPLPRTSKESEHYTLHCDAGRSLCGIMPSGNVVPCIQLPLVFGNLAKQTFDRIWNGAAAKSFRKSEEIIDKSCTYCTIKRFCNRCAGIVFFETGGKWQGAASCLCNRAAALASLS